MSDILERVIKREGEMRSERDRFLNERDTCDLQFEAEIYEDNFGKLYVNSPLEQNLIEMELGRTSGLPLIDVKPDGYRADVQQLETAKYIMNYFLDKEKWYEENRRWKIDKAKYGSAIRFAGITMNIDVVPEYPEGDKENTTDAFRDQKNMKEVKRTQWMFAPKNIPIRMFLFDDRAMRQSNFSRAQDCIMMELLTLEELRDRYGDNKYFNKEQLEAVVPTLLEEGEYGITTQQPMVILYHYFCKQDKKYALIANRTNTLFEGKLIYPDGELPFDLCQHYPNNACMYGIGICRKVRLEKAYGNNMRQFMIDGARMSSGKLLALGSSGEPIDGNLTVQSGTISLASFSNSAQDIRQIDTSMDLNSPLAVLGQIDKDVKINTGIDINSVFEPPADQLGTVEIIEENKQTRNKSTDELAAFSYDNILTKMLKNIAVFAPRLLKTEKLIKSKTGKVIGKTSEYPTLQIPNVTIDNKGVMTEEMGEYGYLDFEPDTLNAGLCVRVVTEYTQNSKMQIIERNKMKEFMQNYVELAKVIGPDVIQNEFPVEQVLQKFKQVNGYDDKKLVADTKKDKTRKKNEEKLKILTELMTNASTQEQAGGTQAEVTGAGVTPETPRGAKAGVVDQVGMIAEPI